MPASSTSSLASSSRGKPNARYVRSCPTVATVMPQAPWASWRAASSGDMAVLPCGASATPARSQYAAIASMLFASADSRKVSSG